MAYTETDLAIAHNFVSPGPIISILQKNSGTYTSPGFTDTKIVYLIREDGLFKFNSDSSTQVTQVLANDNENIGFLDYLSSQTDPLIFFVSKGKTILKTENQGSNWLDYSFNSVINQFEVVKNSFDGNLAVLTLTVSCIMPVKTLVFTKLTIA